MKRYIIALAASRDLNEIVDYFISRDVEAGERFIAEFNKKCRNLVNFPNIGRSYAEIEPSLRGIPLEGYVILYRVADNNVEIVRVVSGYPDLGSLSFGSNNE